MSSAFEVEFSAARGRALAAYANFERAQCALFGVLAQTDSAVSELVFFKTSGHPRRRLLQDLLTLRHQDVHKKFWASIEKHTKTIDDDRNNIAHWPLTFNLVPAGSALDVLELTPPVKRPGKGLPPVTIRDMELFTAKCLFFSKLVKAFSIWLSRPAELDARYPWREIFLQPAVHPPIANHPLAGP